MKSPAWILAEFLCQSSGLFTNPDDALDWPLFVSSMPVGPTQCACVYNTAGKKHGTTARGPVFSRGVQVKVRDRTQEGAYAKAQELETLLGSLHLETVLVDGAEYLIDCVILTGPILSLGQDEQRMFACTVNGLVMFR